MNSEVESLHDHQDKCNGEKEGEGLCNEVDEDHEEEGASSGLLATLMDQRAEEYDREGSAAVKDEACYRE